MSPVPECACRFCCAYWSVWDKPHEGHVHVGTWKRRCTYCGHRVGLNVIETRRQPWRIPSELVHRYLAMRRRWM